MSYANMDSRAMLVDALKVNEENFEVSNYILPSRKSIQAVKELESLENMLLKFAQNPDTEPELPEPPAEPNLDGLSEDQAKDRIRKYEALKHYWTMLREANELKISIKDYMSIKKYTGIFRKALAATPAIKGKRFYALTKNLDKQKDGGILSALTGGDKD